MFGKDTLFFSHAPHMLPFFCFQILNMSVFRYFF